MSNNLENLHAEFVKVNAETIAAQQKAVSELLIMFADLLKEIGNSAVAIKAQHSALCDLLSGFESQYDLKAANASSRQTKHSFEQRIRVLLAKAGQKTE